MIPGPDQIIECPHCKTLARVRTLISGNTFGAQWWTDGKMIAPMLPVSPAITRCRGCGRYFWISQAKVVGEIPPWLVSPDALNERLAELMPSDQAARLKREWEKFPPEWKAAERVRELTEMEYLEAIQNGMAHNREQERYLRICAWWAGNDPLRFSNPERAPTILQRSPEALRNLERLLELLDETNPVERLQKAEVLRELGRFDEALQLLEFDFPDEYKKVADLIRELARRKNPLVQEVL